MNHIATIDAALVTTIATAATVIIGAIVTGIVTILNAVKGLNQRNDERADDVKTALDTSKKASDAKMEEIHSLVNGGLTPVLQSNKVLAVKLAENTGDPADIAVAADATQKLADHQAVTDQAKGTP